MNKWKSNASLTDSRDFSSYDDVIFNAGTAIRRRGVSCLELRGWLHDENENSLSSDSNLQRMRCLSTTINDMKTVRQKQEERKNNMGDLLNDDFWKEHARKLKDAREKIRKLEERYIQRSQGARCSKLDVSSCDQKGSSSFRERNELESSCTHAGFANQAKKDESTRGQDDASEAHIDVTPRKQRTLRRETLTRENFSSECDLLASCGLQRMKIIQDNLDWSRCYGFEGETYCIAPREYPRSFTASYATKWRSTPNVQTCQNTFPEYQTFMYGEAIPYDSTTRKPLTKFTRKTGYYKVNDTRSRSKKQKIGDFFLGKTSTKCRKNSHTLSVSSPTKALALGRVVRYHENNETAYIIELCRNDSGSFGFNISKGYEQRKDGIFVRKIEDKMAGKFLVGLLHVGDEILEVNSTNVTEKSLEFVQKLIKNADKLELAILPFTSRNFNE